MTEYSITDDLIAYTENEDEYLVSRVDGNNKCIKRLITICAVAEPRDDHEYLLVKLSIYYRILCRPGFLPLQTIVK